MSNKILNNPVKVKACFWLFEFALNSILLDTDHLIYLAKQIQSSLSSYLGSFSWASLANNNNHAVLADNFEQLFSNSVDRQELSLLLHCISHSKVRNSLGLVRHELGKLLRFLIIHLVLATRTQLFVALVFNSEQITQFCTSKFVNLILKLKVNSVTSTLNTC